MYTSQSGSYPVAFAGIYQNPRKPTIKFADVCAELALCFEFKALDGECSDLTTITGDGGDGGDKGDNGDKDDKGDKGNTGDANSWEKIAFALTEKLDTTNEADQVEYPTWITDDNLDEIVPGVLSIDPQQGPIVKYHIVRHDHCRLPAGSLLKDHLEAKCAQHLPDPDRRRRHPAYLPHNTTPSDPRLSIMSLSQAPPKRIASGATSPGKLNDDADGEYNMVAPANMGIDLDEARRVQNEFGMACINWAFCCAISGDGRPWCLGQPIGPGIQACHIVPQQHYHLYPVKNSATVASEADGAIEDSPRRLREAWAHTWSPANGILLMAHTRDFFDSRLVSIHPRTLLVRVFVPYQALEPYHGRKAQVSRAVDRNALRHHYDMCCIENMAASRRNLPTSLVTSGTSTPTASFIDTSGCGTPCRGGTGLHMTSSLGSTPNQTSRPASDRSKRQRTFRDGRDKGPPTNEAESWQEADDSPRRKRSRKRRRKEDAYKFDSYIMSDNERQFLADVDWELCQLKAGS